jgi:DEAD/DEAH box helicase domain-containing protein
VWPTCRLVLATPGTENPISLLQAAGRDCIPINPSSPAMFTDLEGNMTVPDARDRPTVDAVIREVESKPWYKGQIVVRRVFEPKEAEIGMSLIDVSQYHC